MSYEDGRRRRRGRDEDAGESYFVSMSDLMAGVLFLFIIMLTNFALQIRNAPPPSAKASAATQASRAESLKLEQAKVDAAKKATTIGVAPPPDARTAALLAVADYLKARRVEVTVDTANGALRFSNDSLFGGGGTGLSPAGQNAIAALAGGLSQVLPCFTVAEQARPATCARGTGRVGAVFLEGHSDTGAPSDWNTSVGQSAAAFQGLIQAQPGLQTIQSGSGQSLLSVGGYGPTRPLSPSDRKANSRLEVRLVLAS